MVFSAPIFIFGFFPIFLLLYFLSPRWMANGTALLLSMLFYAWGEPRFVLIACASAVFDYAMVVAIHRASPDGPHRKRLLVVAVLANLGLLAWFKYANFAVQSLHDAGHALFGASYSPMAQIALPIGISFIVFEKITYVVDVYRGVGAPAKNLRDYLLYVFLFPKLLAGPIIKYHDIEQQLIERPKRLDDLSEGLKRFAVGLAKKVLIADVMGEVADAMFAPGLPLGFGQAWLGAIAFSLQIFFDFSGYSDMAIGIARCMGFRLLENFNRPYLAIGFADFWRRWHISLSSWIRDYLYIPLGGDRGSVARTYANLWICFLASGLWHGAAWTFILWGAYHGLFLTLDRMFMRRLLKRMPAAIGIAITFLLITLGWVIFRGTDFASTASYFSAMAHPGRDGARFVLITRDVGFVMGLGLLLCFLPGLPAVARLETKLYSARYWPAVSMVGALLLFVVAAAKATTIAFHPFLYFRF